MHRPLLKRPRGPDARHAQRCKCIARPSGPDAGSAKDAGVLSDSEARGGEETCRESDKRPRSGNASHPTTTTSGTRRPVSWKRAGMRWERSTSTRTEQSACERCVRATSRFFGVEDNGLAQPWPGRVFLNPSLLAFRPARRSSSRSWPASSVRGRHAGARGALRTSRRHGSSRCARFTRRSACFAVASSSTRSCRATAHDPALGTSDRLRRPGRWNASRDPSPSSADVVVPYAR